MLVGRRRWLVTGAFAVVLAGCRAEPAAPPSPWDADGDGVARVRVLGDSNSTGLRRDVWWLQLAALLEDEAPRRWQFESRARLGAVIGVNLRNPETAGQAQVDAVLAERPAPDVVVLAFGTNDLAGGRHPAEVADDYALALRWLEGAGVRVLLAYTPPCWDRRCNLNAIHALNRQLDARFPSVPKLDFWSDVTPADTTPDGLHFNTDGHRRRRDAALRVLRVPPPPRAGPPEA